MEKVAIIGAGPGGLAAARWLKAQGFAPLIYESHSRLGGQWDNSNPNSGVWPQMRTNTFIGTTQFSDLEYPDGTAVFPRNQEVRQYFEKFARSFGLTETIHFGTKLTSLERVGDGFRLILEGPDGAFETTVSRVVVATGRYNKPSIPAVAGLDDFTGQLGVTHAFHYKNPETFLGARVIVAGGAISALEIASDLAMLGAKSVHLAQRRQRYVMPKIVQGVPYEYYGFSYAAAADGAPSDPEQARAELLEFALRYGGDPARYGAPAPHPDPVQAGITLSQHYLSLVAEDRVHPRPWLKQIDGRTVVFTDESSVEADAIIFGTGFDLNLPFLSPKLAQTLEVTRKGLTLSDFTLHPDVPGLAFIGMWAQNGGYMTVIEQQARYLAYAWGGVLELSEPALRAGVAACRDEEHHTNYRKQNEMALRFARISGTDPAGRVDSSLMEKVRSSATTPLLYRLTGPDALPDAVARFERQMHRYGPAV